MRSGLFWKLHRATQVLFWCAWIGVAGFVYTQRAALQPALDAAELWWHRSANAPAEPARLSGRVTRLYAGDSFQVRDDQGTLFNYGLAGVAVPKPGPNATVFERSIAAASLTNMIRLLEGERADVLVTLANPQNRTGLGVVWTRRINLTELTISNGWSRLNRPQIRTLPFLEQYRLVRAERSAQRRSAGLWAAKSGSPDAPAPTR